MSIDRAWVDKLLENKEGGTHTKCSPATAQCLWERLVAGYGGVLVYDSSTKDVGIGIKPSFYTRIYRIKMDGEFINTWIRFTYDKRSGMADVNVSYKDLSEFDDKCTQREEGETEEW